MVDENPDLALSKIYDSNDAGGDHTNMMSKTHIEEEEEDDDEAVVNS
jgi:hypothetical protein